MTSDEPVTSRMTAAMYAGERRTPAGVLRATIRPEHQADWARIAAEGALDCYEYDPERGYVLTRYGSLAIAARDWARAHPSEARPVAPLPSGRPSPQVDRLTGKPHPLARRAVNVSPRIVHGTISRWLEGCPCRECKAAGKRYRASGGTMKRGALA